MKYSQRRFLSRSVSLSLLGLILSGVAEAHPKIAQRDDRERVPGQWIVVLRDEVKDVDAVADELAARGRGLAGPRFRRRFNELMLPCSHVLLAYYATNVSRHLPANAVFADG